MSKVSERECHKIMKYFGVFSSLLLVILIGNNVSAVQLTHGKGERINPKGFRLSVDFDEATQSTIQKVRFYVKVQKPLLNHEDADFMATITEPTNGQWIYDNVNSRVSRGTIINYSLVIFTTASSTPVRSFHWAQLTGNSIDISPPTKESCAAYCTILSNCERSATTVDRLPVCKGDLIFEENFDEPLDEDRWRHEVRIPIDDKDSFASFQDREENCYVDNGQLHIVPTLLSDVPEYNERFIRNGYLQLKDCTPVEDEERECKRQAQSSQILPPIVSAKIFTDSFSFRYGKVVIRAKMPKGDWIFPLILLDPLENDFGCKDRASGQMRVAHTVGNQYLWNNASFEISSKLVSGGLVMANQNPLDHIKLRSYYVGESLSNDFHNYSLTWTEDILTFGIDDVEYGEVFNIKHAKRWNDKTGPFDREFSFVLGVSVGGHNDFPNGCMNGVDRLEKPWTNSDPKAMLNFWRDRESWKKTWTEGDPGLHIDFIRVYAL